MLWVILLGQVLMWTLYGNIATFYPPYTEKNHKSVSSTMVGVVLAMFECSILIGSPLISITMQKVGRKNYIILGNLLIVLSTVGFGLTKYIDNDLAFFIASVSFRMVQGFGDAACSTSVFSLIGSAFPDDRDLYFGYLESAVGIGLMAGPVIGQTIFNLVDYEKTFYCSALLVSIPLVLQIFCIPSYLNRGGDDDEEGGSVEGANGKKITFWTILTNKRAMLCAVSSIFAMIFMLFMDTILSNYLIFDMHVDEAYVGYFFALPCLIYSISCPLVGYMTKFFPRPFLTQLAFLITFVGMLMFGPS
jgi:MFS family permease